MTEEVTCNSSGKDSLRSEVLFAPEELAFGFVTLDAAFRRDPGFHYEDGDNHMCMVLNKKFSGVPNGSVYIGRPSKWGNPFAIGRDGTREEVIDKYVDWLLESDLIADVKELRGKDLVCWCKPEACHGDVLLALANA